MAKLHALVDAPSVVIIAAATAAHLVLRLDQLFAADIPAPGNFNVGRFKRDFASSVGYSDFDF